MILNDKMQYEKYEDFMVRRVLAVDPDTRWCPAPDCRYNFLPLCYIVIIMHERKGREWSNDSSLSYYLGILMDAINKN
jgi:hypothetical protein